MARIRGRGWCLLVLATETMSMRRGVPGGLRMAPAEAHDALGLIPLQFAGARGEWPRPRIPCPTCGDEMVLKWGNKRRPYFSHLPKWGAQRKCSGGGGEGIKHKWAKDGLAHYLNQSTKLQFFSHCQHCEAKFELGSVPVRPHERTVETEHRLPTGGIADVAVCAGNETKVVIEVYSTHRTATIDSESTRSRPEPWYEVRVDDVLRMLHSTQYYGEIECVRLDHRMCPKCKGLQKKRGQLGNWNLTTGKHENKTFEEASSDYGYVNYLLGKLVKGQYQELEKQIPNLRANNYWDQRIAFELPEREWRNVSSVFRDSRLKHPSLMAFTEYLVNDPDLHAVEFPYGESAARVWKAYKAGQNGAEGVTVVQFDSRSGNWTNPKDAYEGRYYSKRVYDGPWVHMRGKICWMLK